jgi:L-threonylcarbamoyladenylate synthase
LKRKPVYINVDYYCPHLSELDPAIEALKSGGLIVYPTDTLYGLGANPWDKEAVRRVYQVKERPPDRPLPIIIAESHHATALVETSKLFWRLARAFWPGPLTIVAPPLPEAPEWLRGARGIGVRLPNSPVARLLASAIGGAIIGTSANKSGMEPPRSAQEAMFMLGSLVDVYIDAGLTPIGKPSTVVLVSGDRVEVLREGAVPELAIRRAASGG